MSEPCVAVLGHRDEPTDAVEEYCKYLASALGNREISLEIARVAWSAAGWSSAIKELLTKYPDRKNRWFFLQYTALAWSRRGFSWRFLNVLRRLKKNGARCAIVFHDAEAYFGNRFVDRARRAVQRHTMRKAVYLADLSIFTIPPEKISWLSPSALHKTIFIPVGANLPEPEKAWTKNSTKSEASPAVAVFSLSGGNVGAEEVKLIASAALFVSQQIGVLRIVLIGRNSDIAQILLQKSLRETPVQVSALGLLPAEEVVSALGECAAMLFVRGPISSRRGSAIAGIACGLPVIAREGRETAPPITSAGVVLLPPEAKEEFGPALLRVLTDNSYRVSLADRSRQAQQLFFSWQAIATQYANALRQFGTNTRTDSP